MQHHITNWFRRNSHFHHICVKSINICVLVHSTQLLAPAFENRQQYFYWKINQQQDEMQWYTMCVMWTHEFVTDACTRLSPHRACDGYCVLTFVHIHHVFASCGCVWRTLHRIKLFCRTIESNLLPEWNLPTLAIPLQRIRLGTIYLYWRVSECILINKIVSTDFVYYASTEWPKSCSEQRKFMHLTQPLFLCGMVNMCYINKNVLCIPKQSTMKQNEIKNGNSHLITFFFHLVGIAKFLP